MYDAPGCGSAAVGKCVSEVHDCAGEYCGCDGKTIIGCEFASSPFAYKGACVVDPVQDAGPDGDASACPSGQMLVYASAGCDVKPTCSPPPPPCAEEFCGCDGKTVIGCGVATSAYVHKGACVDAAADAATH